MKQNIEARDEAIDNLKASLGDSREKVDQYREQVEGFETDVAERRLQGETAIEERHKKLREVSDTLFRARQLLH